MIDLLHKLYAAAWRRLGWLWLPVLRAVYRVEIGPGGMLVGEPVFRNQGRITIGRDSLLVSAASGNPLWCSRPCIFHTEPSGKITIGNGFKASGCCLLAKEAITVGDNVLLGAAVTILDNDMHSLDCIPRGGIAESRSAPVIIEDNVWIGAGVTVLKGIRIGKNSVIGAGVTLRSDVPARSVVVPASNLMREIEFRNQ